MLILQRALATKEVRAVLNVLDEADVRFDTPAFQIIKRQIETVIYAESVKITEKIRGGISPRAAVYAWIADLAGDLVESGQYHIWRGVLNPFGPGKDLLDIYEAAEDEMVTLGAQDASRASKNKEVVRNNIRSMG